MNNNNKNNNFNWNKFNKINKNNNKDNKTLNKFILNNDLTYIFYFKLFYINKDF